MILLATSFTLSCHTVAFDKTRTLRTGEFMCKAIEPIHGHEATAFCCVTTCEKEALAVTAAMEKGTTHPIGRYCFNVYLIFIRVICDLQSSNGIHPSLNRGPASYGALFVLRFLYRKYDFKSDEESQIAYLTLASQRVSCHNSQNYATDAVREAFFMQDSFEDNKSKILMILCASPDPKEMHKTISTLEYGAKAKCIVRGPHTPIKGDGSSSSDVMLGSRIATT
ncbi:putative kinesin-like protein [Helianthus annuus]|nr:putative kinesin-like protein [Helianthus annuus]KAJ0632581.1 putative kinesin-like protein [Helianthus annuus]KAJ0826489.1 putative kinesin-like protein [Helianthus annuus]